MVRVLAIGPTPPPYNGCAVATRMLLDSPLGEEFRILHLDTADRRGLENSGRFDFVNVWLALVHGLRFLRLLLLGRPEIVYVPIAQNTLGFLRDCLFLIPARMLGKKLIVHVHGGYFGQFYVGASAPVRVLIRWVFRGVSRAIVLGDRLRGMMAGLLPPERVAVIPNGMPPDGLGRRPRGAGSGAEHRVVYLGTLMRTKGFHDALEAAKLAAEQRSDVRFVFAGSFLEPADAEAAARYGPEGFGAPVEFVGVVAGEAKARLLNEADVFVFPTFYPYEGHPFVVLEAMAAGLPVVTTDHGAIAETVRDGENGFLVPKQDPSALAEKVLLLVGDEALRERFGRRSRELFLESFTLERWVARMGEVFRLVAAEGAGAAAVPVRSNV